MLLLTGDFNVMNDGYENSKVMMMLMMILMLMKNSKVLMMLMIMLMLMKNSKVKPKLLKESVIGSFVSKAPNYVSRQSDTSLVNKRTPLWCWLILSEW